MPPVNYAVAENLIEMGRRLARCPQQRNLGSSAKLDRSCRLGTVSKIRGIMYRIYKFGVLHERVDKNPVEHVETRSLSLYKALLITPQQTLAILNRLSNPLHFTLVLTCAATALRASEIVSQRWSDILWSDRQIRISKRWAKGVDGDTKTAASNGSRASRTAAMIDAAITSVEANRSVMRFCSVIALVRSYSSRAMARLISPIHHRRFATGEGFANRSHESRPWKMSAGKYRRLAPQS